MYWRLSNGIKIDLSNQRGKFGDILDLIPTAITNQINRFIHSDVMFNRGFPK